MRYAIQCPYAFTRRGEPDCSEYEAMNHHSYNNYYSGLPRQGIVVQALSYDVNLLDTIKLMQMQHSFSRFRDATHQENNT